MSLQSGTLTDCLYTNTADHTAVASTNSETTLLAGANLQPVLYRGFFGPHRPRGVAISLLARGVFSNTGTPTLTFKVRMGTAAASLAGTTIGASAAITTGSGVSAIFWELRMDLICNTPGYGSGNATLSGGGYVKSFAGFASPGEYTLTPSGGDSATWTTTFDASVDQYLNLSATWSANSASNTITCKNLVLLGLN